MSIKKNWRTTLLVLLITFTFTSVIGGTMAWFTDTVESNTNIIEAGTLDVEMYWNDAYLAPDAEGWKDASSGQIFNYRPWEPGYTQVRYVMVKNVGNLAFDYTMMIKPSTPEITDFNVSNDNDTLLDVTIKDEQYKLADVIDVYIVDGSKTYGNFGEIKTAYGVDKDALSITEMAFVSSDASTLKPGETAVFCIALHMQEEAGNEYQGLSVGDGFAVQVQAKQAMVETDDFGNSNYDKLATYANLPSAVLYQFTEDEIEAINAAQSDIMLETAYTFRTAENLSSDEEDGQVPQEQIDALNNNPYKYWHADFVVTFDKALNAGDVTLAGQYDDWSSSWLSFPLPNPVEAGTPLRLLGEVAPGMGLNSGNPIYINYAELVLGVQKFNCGGWANENCPADTTMTVELRIYETEEPSAENGNSVNVETGKYVTIGTYSYTFE